MRLLNPKIFVIAAIAVLVGIIGVIFITTSNIDTSEDGTSQEIQNRVESITVELKEVSILQVSDRAATIEIQFKLDNPNSRSVIAQLLQYSLFSTSDLGEYKVASGEIGSRPEGMVDGSNYFTLLSNNSVILKDKVVLDYPGNSPELMAILQNADPNWKATGTVFFNLSSMTSGQENEINFESRL